MLRSEAGGSVLLLNGAGPGAGSLPGSDSSAVAAGRNGADAGFGHGEARAAVDAGLGAASATLAALGLPELPSSGQRIRPLVAYAAGRATGRPPDGRFWRGALAIQLAHEASLVHDDIIDGADERRGVATYASSHGIGAALVHGDHLLTAGYRAAATTHSGAFQRAYARAVERTVAAELEQGRRRGEPLDMTSYCRIVLGKSGELLGCALATPALLAGDAHAVHHYRLGRRVGLAYQMLDDLLDYCPRAATGKPPLADYQRGHWTWLLACWPAYRRGLTREEVLAALHTERAGGAVMQRALRVYEATCSRLEATLRTAFPGDPLLPALIETWQRRARQAVAVEAIPAAPVAVTAPVSTRRLTAGAASTDGATATALVTRAPTPLELPATRDWLAFMARHARSFRFAALLFPVRRRRMVERVYAYCRFTDDLADTIPAATPQAALERLDSWAALSRRAYRGERTGHAVLDQAMHEMASAGVPFGYAAELIEGMRMDVRSTRYRTYAELAIYTYRAAGVVGAWLTELFGVHDAALLRRATALGTAMQLTNIARDVGEDLAAGRVYIPEEWLAASGLDVAALQRMRFNGTIEPAYAAVIERLLQTAEREYDRAFEAIPALPRYFQRPVAVAAYVYRGIHARIRANGYDNLNRRAATSLPQKLQLATRAGVALLRARRRWRVKPPLLATALALVLACAFPGAASAQDAACPVAFTPAEHLAAAESRVASGDVGEEARLDVVRAHYFVAVDDARLLAAGESALAQLNATAAARTQAARALREAYRGAFTVLRAKHGRWPPQRLRDTRDGLGILDHAVGLAPDQYEVRYLRLVSGFYLPGIFGRRSEVRADLEALAGILPGATPAQRGPLFDAVVAFVLENGSYDAETRAALGAIAADAAAHPDSDCP